MGLALEPPRTGISARGILLCLPYLLHLLSRHLHKKFLVFLLDDIAVDGTALPCLASYLEIESILHLPQKWIPGMGHVFS